MTRLSLPGFQVPSHESSRSEFHGKWAIALFLLAFSTLARPLYAELAKSAFTPEIAAFVESDATNPPPQNATLFVGSSSIRLWRTLATDFPGHQVINRGFGGSQTSDLLLYLEEIVFPYHPKDIVFFEGTNDLNSHKSPERVFADFQKFFNLTHARLPGVRIYFISISTSPSRFAQVEDVRKANKLIADFCAGHPDDLTFINVFPLMLAPDGTPIPALYGPDRLHMTRAGYDIWTHAVRHAVFHESD